MYILLVIVMAVLIAVIVWNSLKIKPREIPERTDENDAADTEADSADADSADADSVDETSESDAETEADTGTDTQ